MRVRKEYPDWFVIKVVKDYISSDDMGKTVALRHGIPVGILYGWAKKCGFKRHGSRRDWGIIKARINEQD